MVHRHWILWMVVLTFGMQGCGKKPDSRVAAGPAIDASSVVSSDAIAVIDLNVVAEEIGARRKINDALLERESELVGQLDGFRTELGRRVDELRSEHGDNMNDQRQTDLDKTLAENEAKINMQTHAAQTQLAAHHAQLKMQLLEQVRPVAWKVARSRGMSMVMTTSQVYAAGPDRDITQEVIEEINQLNATGVSATAPADDPGIRVAEMPGGGEFMPR